MSCLGSFWFRIITCWPGKEAVSLTEHCDSSLILWGKEEGKYACQSWQETSVYFVFSSQISGVWYKSKLLACTEEKNSATELGSILFNPRKRQKGEQQPCSLWPELTIQYPGSCFWTFQLSAAFQMGSYKYSKIISPWWSQIMVLLNWCNPILFLNPILFAGSAIAGSEHSDEIS